MTATILAVIAALVFLSAAFGVAALSGFGTVPLALAIATSAWIVSRYPKIK